MNKEGWELKKLGEICVILSGSTPKTNVEEYWAGDYNWITPAELNGKNEIVYETERKITKKAIEKTNLKLLPKGTVLLSSRAPIGKVAIAGNEMYCNQGFKNLVCSDKIHNRFLFHFLKGKTEFLNSLGRGATFKEISKEIVSNIIIAIPPFQVQEQIVKQLDSLNDIIAKKKEQLNELDRLAKATFFDMFGDPILNEKGWDKSRIGDVCKTSSGGTPLKNNKAYYTNGNVPWLRSGELNKIYINRTEQFITQKGMENSSAKIFPKDTVLIAMYGATVGQVSILKIESTTNQAICGIYPNDYFVPEFIYFFLREYKKEFIKQSAGGAQPNISQAIIQKTFVIVPPQSLQEKFAKRIEAIEKQKELINKSIKEVQNLFDYTMDKYFN